MSARTKDRLALRPESSFSYSIRAADMEVRAMRAADLFALAIGYGLMLAGFVGGVTVLVDWAQGNPQSVLPQVVALLEWIDGVAR